MSDGGDLWDEIEDDIDGRTAAVDYPELASVVAEHPPPEIYREASIRRLAGLGNWAKNEISAWLDKEVLGSPTNWCRYRTSGAHCFLPGALDPQATHNEGHAIWWIEDRGTCQRTDWASQIACPLGEPGPAVGGEPQATPYAQGGQRESIIPFRAIGRRGAQDGSGGS